MELYVLDSLYRRVGVIDSFESLIWTERFSAAGDFELHIQSTQATRSLFVPNLRLALNESYRVMVIDTVEDATNSDGVRMLKITGFSLEAILNQRLAALALSDLTTDPKWTITDDPKAIADKLFHDICVTGTLNAGDIIAGVTESNIFPADTVPFPADVVTYSIDPESLYTAIKDICDAWGMGFRLVRDIASNLLYFDIYMGSDRTTGQTTLPAVVFSPDFDNLRNTSKLQSSALYKNVAYVLSPVGHAVVYLPDVDSSVAGFERRVLYIRADDIKDVVPADATAKMIQRGKDELAKNRNVTALDGELAQNSNYIYGTDYNLGDLVELRDDDGAASKMQVTEHIFVSDKEGDRSYPTLAVNVFITPGSWAAEPTDLVWADVDPGLHWADA